MKFKYLILSLIFANVALAFPNDELPFYGGIKLEGEDSAILEKFVAEVSVSEGSRAKAYDVLLREARKAFEEQNFSVAKKDSIRPGCWIQRRMDHTGALGLLRLMKAIPLKL